MMLEGYLWINFVNIRFIFSFIDRQHICFFQDLQEIWKSRSLNYDKWNRKKIFIFLNQSYGNIVSLTLFVFVKIFDMFRHFLFCSIFKTRPIVHLLDVVFNCRDAWVIFFVFLLSSEWGLYFLRQIRYILLCFELEGF